MFVLATPFACYHDKDKSGCLKNKLRVDSDTQRLLSFNANEIKTVGRNGVCVASVVSLQVMWESSALRGVWHVVSMCCKSRFHARMNKVHHVIDC
jgi:hypothetical protein